MNLNNDTPISGLPEKQRNPIFDDLLVTSQLISPDQYFTAKLTIATIYALFIANISIADVQQLQQTLNAMQQEINSKLDGSHTHVITEVTGLQNALDNKAAITHSHTIGQIAGLQAALDSKLDNATHTHTISQVTGLQAALNQKAALNHTHDISNISNLAAALANKLNVSLKGVANGLAELDANGKVPLSQSHLFIIERTNASFFPTVGEGGKFYIDMQTGVSYRWDGSTYVPLNTGQDYLQLGETATTAYQGDRGKEAYDHSQSAHAPLDAQKNVQSDWNATSGDAMILNKPATMPPSEHSHTYADLTGTKPPIDAQRNVQSDWFATAGDAFIKNKPTSFPPTSHTHTYNDISGTKPPVNAQKNSDITKAEIEAKLTGVVSGHQHYVSAIEGLQTWGDGLYLALTGGTLTGDLILTENTTGDKANLTVGGNVDIKNDLVATRSYLKEVYQFKAKNTIYLENDLQFNDLVNNFSSHIFNSLQAGKKYLNFQTGGEGFFFYDTTTSNALRIFANTERSKQQFQTDCDTFEFNVPIYFGENSYLKAQNGYTWLPNGVIMQWGLVDDDGYTKNFPIAFPNGCFVMTASVLYDDFYNGNIGNMYYIVSNTQFRLRNGGAASAGSGDNAKNGYIAIGW